MKKKTKSSKNAYLTKGEKAMLKYHEAQEDARHQVSHSRYRVGQNIKDK